MNKQKVRIKAGIKKQKNFENQADNFKIENLKVETEEQNEVENDQMADKDWIIIPNLKAGDKYETVPLKFESYLMKRRKWPLKGFHKRFFVLNKGFLYYARTPSDIEKSKFHGELDLVLCYITYQPSSNRIHIDGYGSLHLKEKNKKNFEHWLKALKNHRDYKQNSINDSPEFAVYDSAAPCHVEMPESKRGSLKRSSKFFKDRNDLLKKNSLNECSKNLQHVNYQIQELGRILDHIVNDVNKPASPIPIISSVSKRDLLKQQKMDRKKGKNNNCSESSFASVNDVNLKKSHSSSIPCDLNDPIGLGTTINDKNQRPVSCYNSNLTITPSMDSHNEEFKFKEDFLDIAHAVYGTFKSMMEILSTEKSKMKDILENDEFVTLEAKNQMIYSLKYALNESTNLNERLQQQIASEKFNDETDPFSSRRNTFQMSQLLAKTMSLENGSATEFFDAMDELPSASSESNSECESDKEINDKIPEINENDFNIEKIGRRRVLPVQKAFVSDGFWSIMKNNIGKDFSKISLPVTLNEPLSTLQRLCEEVEYSDLIDKTTNMDNPVDRMAQVVAFAISSYAYTFSRPKQKPFNPLLGETYECIREDKGWKFIAEQVSHHPPISAVHCSSKLFTFWLDVNVKMKVFGRSCEIEPKGTVNLHLHSQNEIYKWNKVKTCIHNLLMGQCWIEHEGILTITCSNGYLAKINFKKSSWTGQKHHIVGSIYDPNGQSVSEISGKWNEDIDCSNGSQVRCVWRAGTLPDDAEHYFNFSRFAIELNEIEQSERSKYCHTDSRFRPDERALEEGRIEDATNEKARIEQMQRERREILAKEKIQYKPVWFKEENGTYLFNGNYWNNRKDGFPVDIPALW